MAKVGIFKILAHIMDIAHKIQDGDEVLDHLDENRPAAGQPLVLDAEMVASFYDTMEPLFKISRKID